MNIQLPECPLEYQVPHLPTTHTTLVLPVSTAEIDWQAQILPWTLASLINNTDIMTHGIRLTIANENEANWQIDTSILHFRTAHITAEMRAWITEYQHLGTDACIALWLLKTRQHAYNLKDSINIENRWTRAAYLRLCNMRRATKDAFRHAMKEIMGSHLNVTM